MPLYGVLLGRDVSGRYLLARIYRICRLKIDVVPSWGIDSWAWVFSLVLLAQFRCHSAHFAIGLEHSMRGFSATLHQLSSPSDGYARQLSHLNIFSNGIVVLSALAALLLVVFQKTDALIPLYAVGVLRSFTLSQTGMVGALVKEAGARGAAKPVPSSTVDRPRYNGRTGHPCTLTKFF
jgi:hypothetical protein